MNFEQMINKVILGDCNELIKLIPNNSIDLIYVDISYLYTGGYHKHENNCGVGINQKLVDNLSTIITDIDYSIFDDFIRILKKINIFIWCSREQILDILNYFKSIGCIYEILVWCKTNPQPLARNLFVSDIEYCLYFREKGVLLNDGFELKRKYYVSPLNTNDKKYFDHPTIKPIDFVKKHILHTTQTNDVVLDCFCGSGTTCVASKEENRRFIGIEIERKYWKTAVGRCNGITTRGQQSIFTDLSLDYGLVYEKQ